MKQLISQITPYLKQADPTMVVCASILAIGMIGAGVAMGLLSRNTNVVLGKGAVYKVNSDIEEVSGYKAKNRSADYTANDTAALSLGDV